MDVMYVASARTSVAALDAVARFDIRHRRAILAGFGAVFVFSALGATRLVVDSNWLDDFSYDMPIKAITERVDETMGGVTNIIYLFDSGEADGVKEPAVLREIERLQELADEQDPLVRKNRSHRVERFRCGRHRRQR